MKRDCLKSTTPSMQTIPQPLVVANDCTTLLVMLEFTYKIVLATAWSNVGGGWGGGCSNPLQFCYNSAILEYWQFSFINTEIL